MHAEAMAQGARRQARRNGKGGAGTLSADELWALWKRVVARLPRAPW